MENQYYVSSVEPKTDGFCVAGMVCGIVSYAICGLPAIPGLVLSIIGLVHTNKRGTKGKGMAIAGIVTSGLSVLSWIVIGIVLMASGALVAVAPALQASSGNGKQVKDFGSYKVVEGWQEVDADGTSFVYCSPDHVGGKRPKNERCNNIIVTFGTNHYDEDEHEQFREAILSQLGMQTSSDPVQITGGGSTSDKGYIVYIFDITSAEEDTEQIQYYIVGDREYVMVSAMIWDMEEAEEDNIRDVAEKIVDTFQWYDD
ncbi:MAG: DUF4190 domain-containing protein [Clostridiales bacterium]|nr:DUF4190 domain-containing protein [Clostridiales bacterium]